MNIPNQLSLFRIALVPIIILLLSIESYIARYIALMLFIIAAFTDFLDGYIARKEKIVTRLGKFLDPLADKVLTMAIFIQLTSLGEIPAWIVILLVSREMIVSIFRAVATSSGVVISANIWGKLKTVTQMITIILLLSKDHIVGKLTTTRVDLIFLYITLFITIMSGIEYIWANRKVLNDDDFEDFDIDNDELDLFLTDSFKKDSEHTNDENIIELDEIDEEVEENIVEKQEESILDDVTEINTQDENKDPQEEIISAEKIEDIENCAHKHEDCTDESHKHAMEDCEHEHTDCDIPEHNHLDTEVTKEENTIEGEISEDSSEKKKSWFNRFGK